MAGERAPMVYVRLTRDGDSWTVRYPTWEAAEEAVRRHNGATADDPEGDGPTRAVIVGERQADLVPGDPPGSPFSGETDVDREDCYRVLRGHGVVFAVGLDGWPTVGGVSVPRTWGVMWRWLGY